MKNRRRERIMALLLSLAITLAFMPSAVFAVEGNDAAIAEEGQTETVIDDSLEDTSGGQKNISMPEEEELLEGFLLQEASETAETKSSAAGTKKDRGSKLTGNDKVIYDELKDALKEVAGGGRTSTVIEIPMSDLAGGQWEFTADDLGVETIIEDGVINQDAIDAFADEFSFNSNKVIYALLADMPYDLYWFDKVSGYGYSMTDTDLSASYRGGKGWTLYFDNEDTAWSFYFYVSEDYSSSGQQKTTEIDTDKAAAAADAAENAGNIVNNYSGYTDKEKLHAYKDKICKLVTYEDKGLVPGTPYGDIWQMIYVFDMDPETNVVCEGYSKAFQFLCDISDFSSRKIRSGIADGRMDDGEVSGPHMWNIVHMDDNRNYLVDVTNCDDDDASDGYTGPTDVLFLKGCTRGTGDYDFECAGISYRYSKETRAVFADSELELSEDDYDRAAEECTHVKEHIPATGATCTKAGNSEYWHCSTCNLFFADADGNEEIDRDSWIIPASHKMKKYSARKARCETNGRTAYWYCSKCNKYFSDKNGNTEIRANSWVIPATGHSYGAWRTTKQATEIAAGQKARNCTVCGAGEIAAVAQLRPSLPAVSIKKPAAAKKALTVKWKAVSKAGRKKIGSIQIQYSTDRKFSKGVKTVTAKKTAVSKKIKKLKSKKKYYVRIRSYKKDKKGVHVSKWSAVKTVKIK